jgi:hypothetical protein
MKNARTIILINTAFFLLVLALLAYIVLRAACVDITLVEAYSFYNAKVFWWVETLCTGNTHWFNFIAIKTCIFFGVEKTFYLRGFSLLCSFLFLLLVWVFIKKMENPFLKIFVAAFLFLNPFLVDYLALARGYSAGIMFECASLFYAYLYLNNKNIKAATASLFLAGLSAIANFNFGRIATPGACSPSRSVVSKIKTFFVISLSFWDRYCTRHDNHFDILYRRCK